MKKSFLLLLLPLLLAAEGPPADDTSKLLQSLQASYDKIQTIQASFFQTYKSKRFDPKSASGKVTIAKPGKMRWDYNEPKGRLLVSDGKQITLYDPDDRQALVAPQPQEGAMPVSLSFLWGKGNLAETFKVTVKEKRITKGVAEIVLDCVPKSPLVNVEHMVLTVREVDPMVVVATKVFDSLGGETEIKFSSIQIDKPASEKLFAYTPPKGTPVVTVPSGGIKM